MNIIAYSKKQLTIKKLNYILLGIIIIFCVLIIALFFHQNRQIVIQPTSIQQEQFTELYFENHNNLPTKLASPNQYVWYSNPTTNFYKFAFTIHNLENKDMRYSYEVYAQEKTKVLIDKGEISLHHAESKTIHENFTLPVFHERTKIIVNLIEKDQQISFWIERNIYEGQ